MKSSKALEENISIYALKEGPEAAAVQTQFYLTFFKSTYLTAFLLRSMLFAEAPFRVGKRFKHHTSLCSTFDTIDFLLSVP